jgi:hypothetical protein
MSSRVESLMSPAMAKLWPLASSTVVLARRVVSPGICQLLMVTPRE